MVVHFLFYQRTILAIAGEDFSIIASDTRLSEGFQIYTRDSPKTYKLYEDTSINHVYICTKSFVTGLIQLFWVAVVSMVTY